MATIPKAKIARRNDVDAEDFKPIIRTYSDELFEGVKLLWESVVPHDPPWNRAEVVIPAKMASQPELFLVALDEEAVVGAALAGYDGHRGWLYSVVVLPSHQRMGVGRNMVRTIERRLWTLGCRKINLQVLALDMTMVTFYHAMGYKPEDRISMGRRLG